MLPAFQRFKKARVLVVGDVMLDEYLFGKTGRISPEAPVPIVHAQNSKHVLGGAANTAANITSLGGKVSLLGAVGRDAGGKIFKSLCKEQRLNFTNIGKQPHTTKKLRVVSQNQQLMRIDFEDSKSVSESLDKELADALDKQLDQFGSVILSDYAKGFLNLNSIQSILKKCRRKKIPVIIDPRPQHGKYYVGCDYITPNWSEALQLTSMDAVNPTAENVETVAKTLSETLKTNVVLTLGEHGLFYYSKKGVEKWMLPTDAREVYDVSGAGDTVIGVFALALTSGYSVVESLQWANRAAGIVVGKRGTAVVTSADFSDEPELKERVLSREELSSVSRELRKGGKKIVTLNGSFDLLHSGHLKIIKEAKSLGDVVIVGLNSDASVKRYKGKDRPIVGEKQRAEMLLSLRDVDYVHIFPELDPILFLRQIKPDIHVNGSEYGEDCIEAEEVKKHGGKIHLVAKTDSFSTSNIIDKIFERR